MIPSTRKASVAIAGKTKTMLAFPPLKKGGRGDLSLIFPYAKKSKSPSISLSSKGEQTP
jgi:hypothetical protein